VDSIVESHELLEAAEERMLALDMWAGAAALEALASDTSWSPAQYSQLHRDVQRSNAARERFILSNGRLVAKYAIYYYRQEGRDPTWLDDLQQAGQVALITSVDSFNPTIGTRFTTLAVPRIRKAMMDLIAGQSREVALPYNIRFAREKPEQNEEVGQTTRPYGLSAESMTQARLYQARIISLDEPSSNSSDDDRSVLGELEGKAVARRNYGSDPAQIVERIDMKRLIRNLFYVEYGQGKPFANERERDMIVLLFYEGLSAVEAAKQLKMSPGYMSGFKAHILQRLRQIAEAQQLDVYLHD
jgi:RNA polymerase sigma factor (sigma-70 family)